MENQQIAVVGLGLMGSRMARRFIGAGFDLRGYDTDPDRVEEFVADGGVAVGSPVEALEGCWAAVLSLPDSDISRRVCLGEGGIAESGASPLTVFDTTTGRPQDAVDIAEGLAEVGITYCDTTLSGNGSLAERGELVVMVGGPADAYESGEPIFDAIGRSHHHVGPAGSGSRMKLLVNHMLMIHRMALGEVLVVAELSDMDLATTFDVLYDSFAYSKAMDLWGKKMVEGTHDEPLSRVRQSHKDSRLIVEHGLGRGAPLDLVSVVREALAEAESTGLGDLDNSALIEVVRRRAGIGRVDSAGIGLPDYDGGAAAGEGHWIASTAS